MSKGYSMRKLWRSASIALLLIGVILFASDYAVSHSGGMTGVTDRPGDNPGCTCHCANPSGATSVSVTTGSSLTVQAGSSITFTISVSNSNESKAGCDVSVWRGSLTPGNDGLQSSGSQLTHSAPKALAASWTFTYTAPSTAGGDTIYAAGNAVNNDGGNGGGNCSDNWNLASKVVINVISPTRTLSVAPSSISFGNKRVGGTFTDNTLTLTAGGDQTNVTINSTSLVTGARFSTSSSSGSNGSRNVTTGGSETETITFTPNAKGAFTDSLIISSNANSPTAADARKAIFISGTGIQAAFSGQTSIPFGNVKKGQTKQIPYSFNNSGDDTLFITGSSIATGSGTFSIVSNPSPTTIPPGGSSSMTLQFAPSAKQAYTGALAFTASNGVTITNIPLSGAGVSPVMGVPSLTDIGLSKVGLPRNGSLVISNDGDDTLHITSITLGTTKQEAKFQMSNASAVNLIPSQTRTVNFVYTPTAEGTDLADVIIVSDDPSTPSKTVAVTGKGGLPKMAKPTVDTIRFGNVRFGGSATNTDLLINNSGTFDLNVTEVAVSPSQFTLVNKPSSVGPKASSSVSLKFTPSAIGPFVGMAIIKGDDAGNPSDTVYLSGTGTDSKVDIPTTLDFGDLKKNVTRDSIIWLRNLGTAAVKITKYAFVQSANGFSILDSNGKTINPKDSVKVKVHFAPTAEQSYTGTLTVTTDEATGNAHQILISGRGIDSKLTVGASSIEFGTVDSGLVVQKFVTVTNTGTAPATINTLPITGSTAFVLDAPTTVPHTIAAATTDTIYVSFHPVTNGSISGTLTINAAEGSPLQVSLHGVGHIEQQQESVRMISDALTMLEVIPNPASKQATMLLDVAKFAPNVTIQFFDVAGKMLLSQFAGDLSVGSSRIPLTLPEMSGTVFVRVASENRPIGTVQIVITR
jgi:hypothetical protein